MSVILNKYSRIGQYIHGYGNLLYPIGPEEIKFPFDGDRENVIVRQQYRCKSDYVMENLPVLGEPHPDYAGMFVTNNPELSYERAAFATFYVEWTRLPFFDSSNGNSDGGNERIEYQTYTWEKPGIF